MVRPVHHITEIGLQAQQPLAVLTINIMFFYHMRSHGAMK
jgi:hypothetical protein